MRRMVIDASMAAAWALDDEKSAASEHILYESRHFSRITTSLFWHEFRNILVINQKRGRVARAEIPTLLSRIRSLGIEECGFDDDEWIVSLALQHALSAYDAAYLALAGQTHALLATNDRKLARAASASGIELRTVLSLS